MPWPQRSLTTEFSGEKLMYASLQRKPPAFRSSGACGRRGRRVLTTEEGRGAQTAGLRAATPSAATAHANTSRDSRAHRLRKVTREKTTLHNPPPRRPGTCEPRQQCSRGPLPATRVRGDAGAASGATRQDAWDPRAGSAHQAGGGEPRADAQPGDAPSRRLGLRGGARPARARRGAEVPKLPPDGQRRARPSQLRPGLPRDAPATRLT